MIYSRVVGTGRYLPEKRLTNDELAETIDTTDAWITQRTGIKARHIAAEGETTSDLAYKAAVQALEASQSGPKDIDLILVATSTPDLVFPSTATLVQEKLGIGGCPAFDVQAVCAGFAYGLSVADNFIRAGSSKKVLLIGAETFSRILDWTDRRTCVLFGDGAGAVVLEASDTAGIHSTHIHADGQFRDALCVPSGVSKRYADVIEANAFVQMDGQKVFKWAVKEMGNLARRTLAENGLAADEIDWMVPHQANIRIIESVAQKAGLSMDKVVVTVDQHGNTSAASVPMALDVALRDGRIMPGHKIMIEAFGGGFTWGSALLTM